MTGAVTRDELRIAAGCGLVFAVTFALGIVLLAGLLGSFGDSDETFTEYYDSSSNRNASAAGGLLLFGSGLALLPFARGLMRVLGPGGARPSAGLLAPLVYIAAGLLISGAAALSTVGVSRVTADIFDEASRPFQGSTAAVLPQLGYVLIVFSAWTAAILLVLLGLSSLRSGALPRIAGWTAIVAAAALLLAPAISPLIALPLWAAVTAVVLLRMSPAPDPGDRP